MKYANPWHNPVTMMGPKEFDRTGCPVFTSQCGRGQMVTVYPKSQYDYIVDNLVVTQLAGRSPDLLEAFIGVILDGKEPDGFVQLRARDTYLRQKKEGS